MRTLSREAGAALVAEVLSSDYYYGEPFTGRLEHRVTLFPTSYILDDDEFALFAEFARRIGEDEFILYKIEGLEGTERYVVYRWDNRRAYYGHDAAVNAILSLRGRWALLFYQEGFGLFGADSESMKIFMDLLPPERRNDESDLLEHLHGTEASAQINYPWIANLFE